MPNIQNVRAERFGFSPAIALNGRRKKQIKNPENPVKKYVRVFNKLVEMMGLEPTTYALRTHRSPS